MMIVPANAAFSALPGKDAGAPPPAHDPLDPDPAMDEKTFAKDFDKHYTDEEMDEHAKILEENEKEAQYVNDHPDKFSYTEQVRAKDGLAA